MTKLRECPFCGFDNCYVCPVTIFKTSRVVCPACDASGPERMSYEGAEAGWNRRADDRYTITQSGRDALGEGE